MEVINELTKLLEEWDDPLGYHDVNTAEDIIHRLRVELAGKEAVIKMLRDDNAGE